MSTKAIPLSHGTACRKRFKASSPPVEAPILMTGTTALVSQRLGCGSETASSGSSGSVACFGSWTTFARTTICLRRVLTGRLDALGGRCFILTAFEL